MAVAASIADTVARTLRWLARVAPAALVLPDPTGNLMIMLGDVPIGHIDEDDGVYVPEQPRPGTRHAEGPADLNRTATPGDAGAA